MKRQSKSLCIYLRFPTLTGCGAEKPIDFSYHSEQNKTKNRNDHVSKNGELKLNASIEIKY